MAHLDFAYSQNALKQIAEETVDCAIKLGATSAQVEVNESITTQVEVLKGNIDNFATSYESSFNLTVYLGHHRGSIGISQVPPSNLKQIVQQGLDIAKFTQADPANGLADPALLCHGFTDNLNLYNPLVIDNQTLIDKAKNIEDIALGLDGKISNSDGAAISIDKHNFVMANSNNFNLGYHTTCYQASLSIIGNNNLNDMQTDYWYDSKRHFDDLLSDLELANIASYRLLRRLNKGTLKTGNYSAIFESPIAKSLIGNFLGAISGTNLYRHLSFLDHALNTQIFPTWVNIYEDPFIVKGLASCYFDHEGVVPCARKLVNQGMVEGYLLSSYTARKLGMQTTGNAGGNHNILVSPNFNGNIIALAKTMHTGLIIIETIGHGLNMVTGDYSVGASALWVENGEIQFFVDNLTIAGNLKEIYKNIQYIGNDVSPGSILCGSILVNNIQVST